MKLFVILLVLISSLFSKTYNFTETRYSYAFDNSISLNGVINFKENSLQINYENDNREILYEDSVLIIKENEQVLEFDAIQMQRISSFFEVLLMIYSDDKTVLKEHFEFKELDNKTVLNPIGDLSRYIEKVILIKSNKQLKNVKIFLNNGDNITISIEDEIR